MSLREEQCNKVCRILDDVLANRPTERDSLILAVRKAFAEPQYHNTDGLHKHYEHYHGMENLLAEPQIIACGEGKLHVTEPDAFTKWEMSVADLHRKEPQTCFGYDINELIIFAHACRKAGINEKNLHDFILSCENAYAYVVDEMRKAQDEVIKQYMERMDVDNE